MLILCVEDVMHSIDISTPLGLSHEFWYFCFEKMC